MTMDNDKMTTVAITSGATTTQMTEAAGKKKKKNAFKKQVKGSFATSPNLLDVPVVGLVPKEKPSYIPQGPN